MLYWKIWDMVYSSRWPEKKSSIHHGYHRHLRQEYMQQSTGQHNFFFLWKRAMTIMQKSHTCTCKHGRKWAFNGSLSVTWRGLIPSDIAVDVSIKTGVGGLSSWQFWNGPSCATVELFDVTCIATYIILLIFQYAGIRHKIPIAYAGVNGVLVNTYRNHVTSC